MLSFTPDELDVRQNPKYATQEWDLEPLIPALPIGPPSLNFLGIKSKIPDPRPYIHTKILD